MEPATSSPGVTRPRRGASNGHSVKRLRLRTELLISALLIISGLIGAILFVVRRTVLTGIDHQVRASMVASVGTFKSVQQQRELQLSRMAAMLAELPPLKALMTSDDARTIQDASLPFWRLSGSDLFLLADPAGRVMGFHVKAPGWAARLAEGDLQASLRHGAQATWWYADGQLYQVFVVPITAGGSDHEQTLGLVAVGYEVDAAVARQLALAAGSQIALVTGGKIIAATLPVRDERELERSITQGELLPGTGTHPIVLGGAPFQGASVPVQTEPISVRCYVLMSVQPVHSFLLSLNRTILVSGISAVVLAALLLSFVSWTITRPLDNLVAGVRALAAGDYVYVIKPRGSSEVAELGQTFALMRRELLASQRRRIAAERIAALGRAASSLSHDLRHYLAAVVANAEFLYEADRLKLDRDEIHGEIKMAADQMTDLLDALREIAKDESDIAPLPASLEQTIRHAVEAVLTRPELKNRAVRIRAVGDTEGVFDPKKIGRAFINLVLNACEATVQAQGKIDIEIRSGVDTFEVRVQDNGPGIPDSIRATLFDPFISVGKSNGTGLGLAIVSKMLLDHEGSVVVESTGDAGTVFLVKFPRYARAPSDLEQPIPT